MSPMSIIAKMHFPLRLCMQIYTFISVITIVIYANQCWIIEIKNYKMNCETLRSYRYIATQFGIYDKFMNLKSHIPLHPQIIICRDTQILFKYAGLKTFLYDKIKCYLKIT